MKALLFWTSLFCATVAAAEGPTAYVWQLTCTPDERLTFGPYETAGECREHRANVARICEQPLDGPNQPNPDFVRIADVCQEAHNGRDCVCEYFAVQAVSVPARPFRSAADVIREIDAARAAAGGPLKVGP